jgi:hypothetical protein
MGKNSPRKLGSGEHDLLFYQGCSFAPDSSRTFTFLYKGGSIACGRFMPRPSSEATSQSQERAKHGRTNL